MLMRVYATFAKHHGYGVKTISDDLGRFRQTFY
jgi:hypothetical protein